MLLNTNNCLLTKATVGKSKMCVRKLPKQEHIYGFKPKNNDEPVKDSNLKSFKTFITYKT